MVKYKLENKKMFVKDYKRTRVILSIFVLVSLVIVQAQIFVLKSEAQVTKYINYQGKLTDNVGNPVADGPYTIRFRLYNHVSNDAANPCNPGVNACMWEETKAVTTTSGLFTTYLGDTTGFVDTDLLDYNGSTYYLAIEVAGDTEMTPRKRISGALYALNSDRLGGKQESEFADLDEDETITAEWIFSGASTDVQNSLYTDQVYIDVGGTDIDLESTATPTTSGAYAIGANDEFTHSSSTNVQDVLDDLDAAIPVGGTAPTNASYLVNAADPTLTNEVVVSSLLANLNIQGDDAAARTITLGQTGVFNDLVVVDSGNWSVDAAGNSSFTGNVTTTGGDLIVGTTGLSETTSNTDSGAYIVGIFDEFAYSNGINVQDVLDDLDSAIASGDLFTDGGTVTYRTDTADDFAIGSANLAAPFSVDVGLNTVRIGSGDSTNSHLTMYDNAGASGDITYGSDMWTFSGGTIQHIQGATDRIYIDADTITHTDNRGVIDIDLKTDTSNVSAIDVKVKSDTGLASGAFPFGFKSHLVPHSGDNPNANRIAYYADVASDESLASDDFHGGLIGYIFAADAAFNNVIRGSSGLTAFQAFITATDSANVTGYLSNLTNNGAGVLRGYNLSMQHSGAGASTAILGTSNHSGSGQLKLIDMTAQAQAGHANDIYGVDMDVTNNSAANGTNDMYGIDLSLNNSGGAQIDNLYAAQIDFHSSGTANNVQGVRVRSDAGSVNYMMQLESYGGGDSIKMLNILGNANVGIDMSSATFATSDIVLSNSAHIKNTSSGIIVVTASLRPEADATYDLGSSDSRWKDGYFSGTVTTGSSLQLSDSGIVDTNSNLVISANGANYVDVQDTLYVDGMQSDGAVVVNGNLTGTGDIGSSGSPWTNLYVTNATATGTINAGSGISATGDVNFVLGATDKVYIDAATTTHGNAGQGAFEIDFNSNTSSAEAVLVNLDTSGSAGGALIHGMKTGITTGAGDNTTVWGYESSIVSDAAATSGIIGFHASGAKTNSGSYTNYSVGSSHSGSGALNGFFGTLTHSGTGSLNGTKLTLNQNGTGFVIGSDYTISTSTSTNTYGDFRSITHSGNFSELRGYVMNVTHDTAAAATGLMEGLSMTLRNQAQVQDVHGIDINLNHTSDPTGESHGLKISRAAGHVDSHIDLNGLTKFGIDMSGASFASYDILLSSGNYIKGLGSGIELEGTVHIPAGTDSTGYELFVSHDSTSSTSGAIKANVTSTSGNTYGIYITNQTPANSAMAGYFEQTGATGSTYGVYGSVTSTNGWAGYFNGGAGLRTNKLTVGTTASDDYNSIGTPAASHASLDSTNDLYIAESLEVDGPAWFDGGFTDIAEYIVVNENGVDRRVNYTNINGIKTFDLAGSILIADPDDPNKATLTDTPYDKRVVGIIATKPSMIISGGISEEYGYPIVLAGRIHTNVCTENGDIEIGDFITTSSKSGYGMKATEPGMVVGQALESFSGNPGECGQVLVFQNIGWYHNASGFVSNAVTFGLENVEGGDFSDVNTPMAKDLKLTGRLIGYNNNWTIDENGIFNVKEKLPDGSTMDLYALMSVNKEITVSGQNRLTDGEVIVTFDENVSQIIDENYKVLITPTNACNGLMAVEKTADGFKVKELNNGSSNASFDWMVIATRAGFIMHNEPLSTQDPIVVPLTDDQTASPDEIIEPIATDDSVAQDDTPATDDSTAQDDDTSAATDDSTADSSASDDVVQPPEEDPAT